MKKYIKTFLIVFLELLLIETTFKLISDLNIIDYSYIRIIISSIIISLIITLIINSLKEKPKMIIIIIISFILTFYSLFQITAKDFIGVYMSFNVASQAGAVLEYLVDYILCINPKSYFQLMPFILLVIYYIFINKKINIEQKKLTKNNKIAIISLIIFTTIIYLLTMTIPFMQDNNQLTSTKKLFNNPENGSIAIRQFGSTVYGLIDIRKTIFQHENNINNKKEIKEYISNKTPTEKNNYTGYFKNKNLIVIMMESANEILINKEYYPNFYKLYSEGWHWQNNYSPRNSCSTGNNEFSGMTGLHPLQTGCTTNLYKNNKYSTSIFNLFNEQGYETFSFHDYTDQYYDRHVYHKNMGSNKYYGVEQLNIKYENKYGQWPNDEQMMDKVLQIINSKNKPFMTWITTVSTHQPYKKTSSYTEEYQNMIKENYSYTAKAYMSKLKVLDNSIGVLINGLQKQNKLDDTVILLYADHYPYGMNTKYIKEVIKEDLNDKNIEKTPFVIYNTKIKPKTYKEYTSYINITPTIANLFGLNYSSNNYIGKDLLNNNYENKVVFQDGSWKNEYAYYNSANGKIKYYTNKKYKTKEIKTINNNIQQDIDISRLIIKNNYFNK